MLNGPSSAGIVAVSCEKNRAANQVGTKVVETINKKVLHQH